MIVEFGDVRPAVVVADDPGERHRGPGRGVLSPRRVLGQVQRVAGHPGEPDTPRHVAPQASLTVLTTRSGSLAAAARRSVVAAADLVQRVVEHPVQHGQAVPNPAGRARKVDHQGLAGHPGQPAGQHRGRHLLAALGPDRRGQAWDLESSTAAVSSGVESVGEIPVPPEVITRSAPIASCSAAPTSGPSERTSGPVTVKPRSIARSR